MYVNMAQRSGRLSIGNDSENPMEPPLGYEKRQTTAKRNKGKEQEISSVKPFYVDDGLTSRPTEKEAIILIRNA